MKDEPTRKTETRKRRVLVFPGGTEIGLEIHAALSQCSSVQLFAAGQPGLNHAQLAFQEYHVIPSVHDKGWLGALRDLCKELSIQYIFPAHDDVIEALSEARNDIPATLVTSNHEACVTSRSKSATYQKLEDIVPVPKLFHSSDKSAIFPLFVKPDKGQGSSHATVVRSAQELAVALTTTPEPIICEHLPGEEFTVDCFSSRSRGLMFANARQRRRTRNGIAVNTVTCRLPEAWELAEKIGRELKLRGAWFFQLKRRLNGELALLEVAPRISGSMAAHRVMGVNFALLSLLEIDDEPVHVTQRAIRIELDRALCNRYRSDVRIRRIYVDCETLVPGSSIDPNIMRLICRCINECVHLTLITERAVNPVVEQKLRHLFDTVVQTKPDQPRSIVIDEPQSAYIDNDLDRRLEVQATKGILTLDSGMTELLYSSTNSIYPEAATIETSQS